MWRQSQRLLLRLLPDSGTVAGVAAVRGHESFGVLPRNGMTSTSTVLAVENRGIPGANSGVD